MLELDFETRSEVNLITDGAYNYAMHPSTSVICVAFTFEDDDEPVLWNEGEPIPQSLIDYLNSDGLIKAHNAQFERLIFWYVFCPDYNLPEPALERFYCTAAQARANAYPGKLDDLGRALGSSQQKSRRGWELINLLSIPRADGTFNRDPALLAEMGVYCQQDVRTERESSSMLRPLSQVELEQYWMSERINDRGIKVDHELAVEVVKMASAEQETINAQLAEATLGEVVKARSPKLTSWVHDRVDDDGRQVMRDDSKKSRMSLDASTMDALLQLDTLPELVREVLTLKGLASASSVAKYKAMVDKADPDDGRVRGAFMFCGAGQTHRYSSRGLQLHNMPRDCADNPVAMRAALMKGSYEGDLLAALKSMLRPSILAERGKSFVCSDWAGIEARVLPWLSNDPRAEIVLLVFRRGDDIYLRAATDVYGRTIYAENKAERQIGKVVTLALGFQGGVHAFQSMAKNYGVMVSDARADEIKVAWRAKNPWAVDFWKALDVASKNAVRNPGEEYQAGRVTFLFQGGTLWCALPSGTVLAYPQARLEIEDGPYGAHAVVTCLKASIKPKAGAQEWTRMGLYGGLLAENVTQAVAGDVLREAQMRVDNSEWWDEMVLHVHDEIMLEVPDEDAADALECLEEMMVELPTWAEGLPLDVESWIGKRYKK